MDSKSKGQSLAATSSSYISLFFKNKKIPYQKWDIIVDGVNHVIDNKFVIDSILQAEADEQRLIAETLYELDSSGIDINVFLKHLAFESNCLSRIIDNQ
ncbi:MAG: hypothetical protein DIZ80_15120 [endosymbiont of Galathealinum brachiosum]|uniref:Uncharacterized protein n=1 Tax=endosymbiont of Galathealinum brachiosum TaxID=2200906 RepID=A0A370DB53_9GAMM|nr:MAG: hypothetical protein DIZ80_15120 [endosymbiont of Galathealinum brachiosum]